MVDLVAFLRYFVHQTSISSSDLNLNNIIDFFESLNLSLFFHQAFSRYCLTLLNSSSQAQHHLKQSFQLRSSSYRLPILMDLSNVAIDYTVIVKIVLQSDHRCTYLNFQDRPPFPWCCCVGGSSNEPVSIIHVPSPSSMTKSQ